MLRSDVDKFLEDFPVLGRKIFIYKQEFVPNEYVTIERTTDNQFQVTKDKTIDIPNFVDQVSKFIIKDEFIKLLCNEELKEYTDTYWNMNIMDLKTGGCDCGSWATQNPDNHIFWCKKYFKIGY